MSECGTTCLAMIFKYYGLYNAQAVLRELGHVTAEGTDLYALSEVAELFGFNADGYQLGYDELLEISLPCIAHYEGNHFIVIYKINKDHVWVVDPGYGKYKFDRKEFEAKWNGIILTLEPTENVFKNKDAIDLVEKFRKKEKNVLQQFYLSILYPFKKVLFEILLATFLLQLMGLALPFFTQSIIDKVLVYQDRQMLFAILMGMMGVFFLQLMLTYVRNILLTQFSVEFELNFFSKFFYHLLHLRQPYFDKHRREDFIQRFQENLKIRSVFSSSVLQSFLDLLFVVNFIVVLFYYNGLLATVALVFVILFITITILFTPKLRQMEAHIFNENIKTMGSFLDTLMGMQTVKLLHIEKLKFWEWKNNYRRALNKVFSNAQVHMFLTSTLKVLALLSQITVYFMGAYLAFNNTLSIGQYIAFISIYGILLSSVNSVSSLWFMFTEISVTYSRLNDVFIQETEETNILEQATVIHQPVIELKDLSFTYSENSNEYVLKNVSTTINYGQRVGIVGRNGSGKSTVVKMLVKMYPNYKGNIFFNNNELRNIHPVYLRKKVFMIPQDVYLFGGTIKDNILYANPNASIEDVIKASKLADLHGFVSGLFLGYNYKIGEGGANLSGGQKLKVGFARLFLCDPEVIILDEASSALDVETEQRIMQNVYEHFKGKTIISIAHRLNTLKNADKIIVIDKGSIMEQGTHQALLDNKGLYYQFMKTFLDF